MVLTWTLAVTSAVPGERFGLYGTVIRLLVPLKTAAEPVNTTSWAVPVLPSTLLLASFASVQLDTTAACATPPSPPIATVTQHSICAVAANRCSSTPP